MKLRIVRGGWLLAGLLISGAPGYAGVITGVGATAFPPASTGSIGPVGVTPAPNNDEADATNPNTIPYPSLFFNSLGILDVEYLVADSGGVTEYRVLQSLLVNNTGQAWSGFQFELGFGIGAAFWQNRRSALVRRDYLSRREYPLDFRPLRSPRGGRHL